MFVFFSVFLLFFIVGGMVGAYHFLVWGSYADLVGSRSWVSSFECGFSSSYGLGCYFSYTYFILLVFFVVFDLEVSLLLNLPFGFCYYKSCLFYLLFLIILGVGYGFELYNGYVRWSY